MALIGSQKFDQDEVRVMRGGTGVTTIHAGDATWAVKPDGTGREAVYATVVRQFSIQGYEVASEDGVATTLRHFAPGAYETAGPTAEFFLERTDMGWEGADTHADSYDSGLAAAASVEAFANGGPHPVAPSSTQEDVLDGPEIRSSNFPAQAASEALALVRAGNKIGAIIALRAADPSIDLLRAKEIVEAMAIEGLAASGTLAAYGAAAATAAGAADFGLPPHVAAEVVALLRAGQNIQAIKMVRDADPRLGLKEAKNLVDEAQRRTGIPKASGGGCAGMLIFAAGSAATFGACLHRLLV